MSTNEERKTCIDKTCLDCEFFDIMTEQHLWWCVCLKDSYIDGDDDAYLQWMYPQARACEHFKEIEVW